MTRKPDSGTEDKPMSLTECAGYLHLSEKTVIKLAQNNKLPGELVARKWSFQRAQIDEWLQNQLGIEEDDLEEIPDGICVPLEEVLPEEAVIQDLEATTALGVIEELAARAYASNWLNDKPWFVGAVVEREALASTAMGGGVAFLHTRARESGRVARPFIVVGRSYNGVAFGAPDGKPTFLFFLLGLKYDKLHLPILGRLARCMRNPTTVAKLRSLPSPAKMRALLLKADAEAIAARAGEPVEYEALQPKLDRQMRLRTIMRLNAVRKHRAKQAEEAKKKAEEKAERKTRRRKSRKESSPPALGEALQPETESSS